MSDEQAREVYARARLGESVTLGSRPAVLVVDFSCGFTDPACTLGSDLTAEVEATKRLLDAAREKGLPVVFTTIGFEPSLKDGGLWLQKAPGSPTFSSAATGSRSTRGSSRARTSRWSLKKGASGFFGTNLAVDPRLAAGRLRDPLRRDDERVHPRHRSRPAPVRLADARPAGMRRRPCAGPA